MNERIPCIIAQEGSASEETWEATEAGSGQDAPCTGFWGQGCPRFDGDVSFVIAALQAARVPAPTQPYSLRSSGWAITSRPFGP